MLQLFISDLHLDDERPATTRAFLHFLQQEARDADQLYILGDFFESWIGDDDSSPLIDTVTAALRDLSASGTELFIMQGNRDFLLGENFCHAVGAKLLADPTVITLAGEPTLLMHGDSLCTADSEYMAFRQMARSDAWQQEVLAKPLEERRALARQLRMASFEANSNKADDIMDVTPEEVSAQMVAAGCLRLIHGHTHRPNHHAITIDGSEGDRWVLGDWVESAPQNGVGYCHYLLCEGNALQLKRYNFS